MPVTHHATIYRDEGSTIEKLKKMQFMYVNEFVSSREWDIEKHPRKEKTP